MERGTGTVARARVGSTTPGYSTDVRTFGAVRRQGAFETTMNAPETALARRRGKKRLRLGALKSSVDTARTMANNTGNSALNPGRVVLAIGSRPRG